MNGSTGGSSGGEMLPTSRPSAAEGLKAAKEQKMREGTGSAANAARERAAKGLVNELTKKAPGVSKEPAEVTLAEAPTVMDALANTALTSPATPEVVTSGAPEDASVPPASASVPWEIEPEENPVFSNSQVSKVVESTGTALPLTPPDASGNEPKGGEAPGVTRIESSQPQPVPAPPKNSQQPVPPSQPPTQPAEAVRSGVLQQTAEGKYVRVQAEGATQTPAATAEPAQQGAPATHPASRAEAPRTEPPQASSETSQQPQAAPTMPETPHLEAAASTPSQPVTEQPRQEAQPQPAAGEQQPGSSQEGAGTTGNGGRPENPPTGAQSEPQPALTPPPSDAAGVTGEQTLEQKVDAELALDPDYKQQREDLEGEKFKAGRDIDSQLNALVQPYVEPQRLDGETEEAWKKRVAAAQETYEGQRDDQDDAIDNLTPEQKKAYEAYIKAREDLEYKRQEAIFRAREAAIAQLPADKQEEAKQQLALDKIHTKQQMEHAVDFKLQQAQRRSRRVERSLARMLRDGKRMYNEQYIQDLKDGKISWNDIKDDPNLVGEDRLFRDKAAFQQFRDARNRINNREDHDRNEEVVERLNSGNLTDQQKNQLLEEHIKKMRTGPGRIRRGMRKLSQGIEFVMSKNKMVDSKKAAINLSKGIIDAYGWRGLLAQRLLPAEDRKVAKYMRHHMFKELGTYLGRRSLRSGVLYILLSAASVFLLPIIMTKTVDMLKPFGK